MSQGTIIYIVLGFIIGTIACSGLATGVINGNLVKQKFDAIGTVGNNSDCTGTLIPGNLVLTAAHCFEDCHSSSCRANFTLYNITPKNKSNTSQDYSFYGLVIVNPKYKDNPDGSDLALIKLDKNVSQILRVEPIHIDHYLVPLNTSLTFVGFGNISTNCEILNLRNKYESNASVKLVSSCDRILRHCSYGVVTGICPGDSGGPALDKAGKIVGIVKGQVRSDHSIKDYENSTWTLTRISNQSYNWTQNVTQNATF
jgi:V8-like Glu-specific endopeptidase